MTQIAVCIIVVSISCLCGVTEATVPSGAARLESFEGVHMSNIPEDIKRRIPQLDQVIGQVESTMSELQKTGCATSEVISTSTTHYLDNLLSLSFSIAIPEASDDPQFLFVSNTKEYRDRLFPSGVAPEKCDELVQCFGSIEFRVPDLATQLRSGRELFGTILAAAGDQMKSPGPSAEFVRHILEEVFIPSALRAPDSESLCTQIAAYRYLNVTEKIGDEQIVIAFRRSAEFQKLVHQEHINSLCSLDPVYGGLFHGIGSSDASGGPSTLDSSSDSITGGAGGTGDTSAWDSSVSMSGASGPGAPPALDSPHIISGGAGVATSNDIPKPPDTINPVASNRPTKSPRGRSDSPKIQKRSASAPPAARGYMGSSSRKPI